MEEIWEKVIDAPNYEISNYGRVRNRYGKILVQKIDKAGYHSVGLCRVNDKRKWFLVHRLVLSTFKPIKNMNEMEVNHKDENKHNNNIDNLEWMTSKENCNYGTRNERINTGKKVKCVETGVIYNSCKEASELTGACKTSISNCIHNKRNKAGNYHWEEII